MRKLYESGICLGNSAHTLLICILLLSVGEVSAAGAHRVLLIHSFGRDYAPFDSFTRTFRNDLAEQIGEALVFYDVNLESARVSGESSEIPFTTYLSQLFEDQPPDLVVPIGGPAARFAQRQRLRLFPNKPMLIGATDERHVRTSLFATNDAAVCCQSDPAMVIAGILQVLPSTTNIAVVIGDSPLERFWLEEIRRDFQRFSNRCSFTYYNHLSFFQIQQEVKHLPPRSAVYFGLLYVDAEGVPFAAQRALSVVCSIANAPVFSNYDTQLGLGIVGGPVLPITKLAAMTAEAATRLLRGEPASAIKVPAEPPSTPIYDWRQLKRWGISERRLAPGSSIRYRERTFWEQYKGWLLPGLLLSFVVILVVHFRHAAQLRAAEEGQAAFTRQLIVSQEDERRRIAGELHDGLGQILILIKNQLGLLSRKITQNPAEALTSIEGLARTASQALGEVRSISQALRPMALEQVGVTAAIESLARQAGESSTAKFSVEIDDVDGVLPAEQDINLYRIVQEGLNNVLKHSQARHVSLEVKRSPQNLSVSILDDGIGFDVDACRDGGERRQRTTSLGLVSITERSKLLGGSVDIQSAQGTGTRLTLTVPLGQAGNGSEYEEKAAPKTSDA